MKQGVLTDTEISALIDANGITATRPFEAGQIQPASLDLRLGTQAFRVRASFLTGKERTVTDRLSDFTMHEID
ncbi:MAG: 2'-deoxycytidine 5'-triphosphate deaminase, partial [Boseongicola sp.]|nr:2'-deoxycytidine 5'-triphosphate deaminase [Boseongicola sp.]